MHFVELITETQMTYSLRSFALFWPKLYHLNEIEFLSLFYWLGFQGYPLYNSFISDDLQSRNNNRKNGDGSSKAGADVDDDKDNINGSKMWIDLAILISLTTTHVNKSRDLTWVNAFDIKWALALLFLCYEIWMT